ncbi:phage tail tape measure protein [Paenibacillus pini]|uniref:Phage tail tape measure protein domain-containing protein n=1 Tax=Paenibacillus pini JCM 16418 TaxID=1236976 RepID=W7YEA4_9BACL|nr:phage tail tape measure protein [Paenibacillus pini]GAF06822.1 hypothetical protein JCM16418_804 [Paenibacillus pini JCM 16418]
MAGGAIGNMTFGIGFKIKANELYKATKDIDALKGKTKGAADEAGKASSRFAGLGKTLGVVGGVAAGVVVAGFVAVGAAAWKAGEQSRESTRILQSSTGATGKELDGLLQSYRNLGSVVPDDLGVVAKVMADVSKGTRATGKSLEDMSGKILSLNTLTGVSTDVMGVNFPRAMGAWGISADQGGAMMDKMFFISQKTGVGVDVLAEQLKTFSGPLRQMGFDFDTSTAMLGKWANEGVNTELVAGSLRIALGKMSKDGVKDTRGALDIVIKKIKDAGSAGEATALAMEAFGAKAGPDMADTIREGRFELGNLVTDMKNSKGLIDDTYNRNMTFGDKMGVLKNKILVALGPLGEQLSLMAEKAFPVIENLFNEMSGKLMNALPSIEKFFTVGADVIGIVLKDAGITIGFLKENIDYVIPVLAVFATGLLVGLAPALWATAVAGWAAMAPFLPLIVIVLAVAAAVVGVIYVFKHWGAISTWLIAKWNEFKTWTLNLFNGIISFFKTWGVTILVVLGGPIAWIVALIIRNWDQIKSVTISVFTGIWSSLVGIWNSIVSSVTSAGNSVLTAITGVWSLIRSTSDSLWTGISNGVSGMWSGIKNFFIDGINWVVQKINGLIGSLNSAMNVEMPCWMGGENLVFRFPRSRHLMVAMQTD